MLTPRSFSSANLLAASMVTQVAGNERPWGLGRPLVASNLSPRPPTDAHVSHQLRSLRSCQVLV
eukprot:scaffold24197_cov63-Phaeocystis_antarctica.AAC.3